MAVRVVDPLQSIQIRENDKRAAFGAFCLLEVLVGQRHEAAPIVQAGQLVQDGQVFQPFFRLDRSRNVATGGSGLGLAIVQQLCQAQGWRVRIQEGAEGGTDVVVTL